MVATHLLSPSSLPTTSCQLSVLSYNVLLPNSVDGWWNYKMYHPPLTPEKQHVSTWEYRHGILSRRIGLVDADVVCFQEVSPESFENDFEFMQALGYDEHELFKKGRFRPATFWKSSRVELAAPPVHKDRTLLTALKLVKGSNESEDSKVADDSSTRAWHVLNCHLQAGPQGGRRVRQINEGVRAAMTLARKLKEPNPESMLKLIVCGDFNGGDECGAVRYLEDGFVDETFLEDGEPVSSKRKSLPLSQPMLDVAASVARKDNEGVPPTLVVPEFISVMVKQGNGYETPELSDDIIDRLTRIYSNFAKEGMYEKVMNVENVEEWLVAINGKVGRGSEFRAAAREMGYINDDNDETNNKKKIVSLPSNGILSLDGFLQVYQEELRGGKFWGIAHDLAVLGEPLPYIGLFTARFDRMYCSSTSLKPCTVMDSTSVQPCPNDNEPSDHLPVAAAFEAVN